MSSLTSSNLLTVPVSIEAKSRDDLTKLMLAIQGRLRLKIAFFDIQFAQGKWIAWYEVDFRSKIMKAK